MRKNDMFLCINKISAWNYKHGGFGTYPSDDSASG
jgi:hypothetical protein